ncbi:MAG TPA: hypothetical protein VHD35_01310 [Chitinophagaceae bacterium]|nr:hypothetical protein [Chitinophagaceae bacterium]
MLFKIVTCLVLISHINFSMFIAQVNEIDTYDKSGQQQEDINSLAQYLEVICHVKHKPLQDSDDDNARYFQAINMVFYEAHQYKMKEPNNNRYLNRKEYSFFKLRKYCPPFREISSPPPRSGIFFN